MDNQSPNRNILLLAAAVGLILIGGLVFIISNAINRPGGGATPTPSTSANQDGATLYTGTNLLIARGATTQHVENFKFAVYQFTQSQKLKPKEVTVTSVKHIHDPNNQTAMDILEFQLVIDQKTTYQASLQYNDVSSSRLILRNAAGQQLHDSGVVQVDRNQ